MSSIIQRLREKNISSICTDAVSGQDPHFKGMKLVNLEWAYLEWAINAASWACEHFSPIVITHYC